MSHGYPARVTTYNLRNASPAKTSADAVVVGVVKTGKGLEPVAGEIAEAWGRNFRPLLSTLGLTGKPGETAKVPTAGLGDGVSAVALPSVDE